MENLEGDVLSALCENARQSDNEIALSLNVSVDDVLSTIKVLEDKGVLLGYTAIVNEEKLGEGAKVRALVELCICPQKQTGYEAIAKKIYEYPNVVAHYLVSGQYDFLVVVEGKTHQEIAHFVFDKLATLENVTGTTSHFVLKKYKENALLLEQDALDVRVAVMP